MWREDHCCYQRPTISKLVRTVDCVKRDQDKPLLFSAKAKWKVLRLFSRVPYAMMTSLINWLVMFRRVWIFDLVSILGCLSYYIRSNPHFLFSFMTSTLLCHIVLCR